MKKLAIAALFLGASLQVQAGGYRVSLQGQKALGMGHTGVAINTSAEAVFFNPGAIVTLDGTFNITGSINLVDSEILYQNEQTNASAGTDNSLANPLSLYGTWKQSEKLAWGFGIYTPYGSTVDWETDWAGSHLVNNIELRAIYLQPTVAYAFNDTVSLGFGPIVAIGAVDLNRNLSQSLSDSNGDRSNVTIEDSGIIEFGYSIGLFYQATDALNFGINYRSEITMNSEGDADFDNIPTPLQGIFVDGGYRAELPLPAELTLGVSYQWDDQWTLAFDYNYAFWGVYENLTFEFDSINDPDRAISVSPRNYQNSSIYRLGLEYLATSQWALRGGFYFDESPVQDGFFAPETPRADSTGFTTGFTYTVNDQLSLDAAFLYLYFGEEDNSYDFNDAGPFEGTYKNSAISFGFGLTYKI